MAEDRKGKKDSRDGGCVDFSEDINNSRALTLSKKKLRTQTQKKLHEIDFSSHLIFAEGKNCDRNISF